MYPATSPYQRTSMFNDIFLDVMNSRPIPKFQSDVYWVITPVYEFRPDMLANDLYTDSRLWWIFAVRNPNTLPDPLFDFVSGVGIYLPKLDVLKQYLGI